MKITFRATSHRTHVAEMIGIGGQPLRRCALHQAMQHLKELAREAGVLQPTRKFGPHGLKRMGVTKGTKTDDKRDANGHKQATTTCQS